MFRFWMLISQSSLNRVSSCGRFSKVRSRKSLWHNFTFMALGLFASQALIGSSFGQGTNTLSRGSGGGRASVDSAQGSVGGSSNGASNLSVVSGSLNDQQRQLLIPQTFLQIIHDNSVHEELEMTEDQVAKLERYFGRNDNQWWLARLLPADKNRIKIGELEQALREALPKLLPPQQMERLLQIERRSQGARFLLRSDSINAIKLTKPQLSKIEGIILQTEKETAALAQDSELKSRPDVLQKKAAELAEAEQKNVFATLDSTQIPSVQELIGKDFDLSKVKRIYPMAPELVPMENWFNSSPLTMAELRGKVVVIHFYAFQCINCQRNFHHYNRWHETLSAKGVQVIGIQSPETVSENDPAKVKIAATKDQFAFPVIFDADLKNWNAWGTTMWPTVYVVDKKGYIRSWWQGELNYQGATGDKTIENLIEQLLEE